MLAKPGGAHQKSINRRRALGGGWGGGGPNPSPPSNVVPQCTTLTTLNQDPPSRTQHTLRKWSSEISRKKCNLEVRRAFCKTRDSLTNQKSEKVPRKKTTRKMNLLENQSKKCKLEVGRAFCNTMTHEQLSKHKLCFDWL